MRRVANRMRIKPGTQAEYKRRHDEIWPELSRVISDAGIHNYSIWCDNNDLFSYYEVDDYEKSNAIIAESEVVRKWNEYMGDILEFDIDPKTGARKELMLMFLHS